MLKKKYYILLIFLLILIIIHCSLPIEKKIFFQTYGNGSELHNQVMDCKLYNLSTSIITYGAYWSLEYYHDGQWDLCKREQAITFEAWADSLMPMFIKHFRFDLTQYGELDPGNYRIKKNFTIGKFEDLNSTEEEFYVYCYFSVK